MKLLQISALYPPMIIGGAEKTAHKLSVALTKSGWDVDVLTLAPEGGGGLPEEDLDGAVGIHRIPLANLYWPYDPQRVKRSTGARLGWHVLDTWNPFMARRVERFVRELKPTLAMTHNLQGFSTAVWEVLARNGVPVVHVIHDFALLCPRTILFRDGSNCEHGNNRCLDCRLLTQPRVAHSKHVTAVVAVSKAALRIHRQHGMFTDVRARVIHNSATLGVQPQAAPRERALGEPFTFGFIGRIDPPKGIQTLLEAMSRLEQQGYRPKLRVAGRCDADYIRQLQTRWPLQDVDYVGFVDSASFLRGLDALVVPTYSLEALGNVVFEAYFQGVPVIGTNQGGVLEMIDIGRTGYVFKAGDAEDLAGYMRKLYDDPAATRVMAQAALEKAPTFTAEVGQRAYDEFLRSVMQRDVKAAS